MNGYSRLQELNELRKLARRRQEEGKPLPLWPQDRQFASYLPDLLPVLPVERALEDIKGDWQIVLISRLLPGVGDVFSHAYKIEHGAEVVFAKYIAGEERETNG